MTSAHSTTNQSNTVKAKGTTEKIAQTAANGSQSTGTISFVKAAYQDVGFLTYLRKLTMEEHLLKAGLKLSDEQHVARVHEHFSDSYLIKLGQATVGLIKLGVENGNLHIRQFQILPQYQNKGIGDKVLLVCKRKASEQHRTITLNVLHDNPAKQLYLRHGFVIENTDNLQHFMRYSK
ncbi:GNAT family N-acetyltransferase [Thalassotalea euphylliae]|nr:GNAT family N-acetyltransferase [Thalassotalea euphylliae]